MWLIPSGTRSRSDPKKIHQRRPRRVGPTRPSRLVASGCRWHALGGSARRRGGDRCPRLTRRRRWSPVRSRRPPSRPCATAPVTAQGTDARGGPQGRRQYVRGRHEQWRSTRSGGAGCGVSSVRPRGPASPPPSGGGGSGPWTTSRGVAGATE